jgi:hypothetical protein
MILSVRLLKEVFAIILSLKSHRHEYKRGKTIKSNVPRILGLFHIEMDRGNDLFPSFRI